MRYTGADCPRAAAHALTEHVPLAVVTLGADGAYAVDRRTGSPPRSRRSPSRPSTPPARVTSSWPVSSPAPWPAGRSPTGSPSPVSPPRSPSRSSAAPSPHRAGRDRRLVAQGPLRRGPGPDRPRPVRVPRRTGAGGGAGRRQPLAAAPGGADDRVRQVHVDAWTRGPGALGTRPVRVNVPAHPPQRTPQRASARSTTPPTTSRTASKTASGSVPSGVSARARRIRPVSGSYGTLSLSTS